MRSRGVVARVPAKVNLQLAVGPLGNDGFRFTIHHCGRVVDPALPRLELCRLGRVRFASEPIGH